MVNYKMNSKMRLDDNGHLIGHDFPHNEKDLKALKASILELCTDICLNVLARDGEIESQTDEGIIVKEKTVLVFVRH